MLNRRGFLTGLIAAPAVIRVAPLMKLAPVLSWEEIVEEVTFVGPGGSLLTVHQITREAIRLFKNSNSFLQSIDKQYTLQAGANRIVLPFGYKPWPL